MTSFILFFGLLGGFFLPGFFINRILSKDNDFGAAYIISAVILFHIIFWTGICGIKICLLSIAIVLVLINLSLFCYCLARKIEFKTSPSPALSLTGNEKLALIPVFLSVILILLKSSLTPLGDQTFRWYFLASRIFETGSFAYYPPLSPDDYNLYFYTDSFPPIVSFSYFWLYSLFGKAENVLVSIPVILQFIFILGFGYRLSTALSDSKRTGIFSILLMGSSTLLFYSVMIAQETGMTALSMLALIYFLVRRNPCSKGDALMAAFAASLGALSREYGGIFILCGIIVIIWRQTPFRILFYYLIFCAVLTLPWYMRTFILTGNPFYSNPVGGLFTVNPVHTGIFDGYKEVIGLKNYLSTATLKHVLVILSLTFALPFFLGIFSIVKYVRLLGFLLLISLLMASLWIYSMQVVPGGLFHSMRILSPVIAILAVSASYYLGSISREWPKIYLPLLYILSFLCLLTFVQDIAVPRNPLNLKLKDWPLAIGINQDLAMQDELIDLIKILPEGANVLSDNAFFHALNSNKNRNIKVIPVWSPEVRFLFESGMSFEEGNSQLKKCGINYVVLNQKDNLNMIYLQKFDFFRKLHSSAKPLTDKLLELP